MPHLWNDADACGGGTGGAKDQPSAHLTIFSPIGGTVIERLRNQGDYVQVGEPIYRVADLSHLWVMLEAYESDLVWLRYGQQVLFTTSGSIPPCPASAA